MKRFEFKKKFIESELPPKKTDVYWIDTNENSTTKDVLSIKEYVNGEWKSILGSGGSSSSDNSTGYDNFVKLDEGVYFLQTSTVQIVPNDTVKSLQLYQNTIEGSNPHLDLFNWKDLCEYYDEYYNTTLSTLKLQGIVDDAKILSNLNDSYKSKYYLFRRDPDIFLNNVEFPENAEIYDITDAEPYLKEIEPLFNFKTSYLKLDNDDQSKIGSCKIFVYCKEQGTINELYITIGIDRSKTFTISRVFIDTFNFKKSVNYALVSAESLATDDESAITEMRIKSDQGEGIYENQCIYNTKTNKIDVTGFDFMGWGNKTSKPVPLQYWIDSYDNTKNPELGLYYRCTPTETPTIISDYLKKNSGVELNNLTVTKLYLPKYNKCFYLIDNTIDTDIEVGMGTFKECDISTKFDANW